VENNRNMSARKSFQQDLPSMPHASPERIEIARADSTSAVRGLSCARKTLCQFIPLAQVSMMSTGYETHHSPLDLERICKQMGQRYHISRQPALRIRCQASAVAN